MPTSPPVSRGTAPHYTWGDRCDGWHLVAAPGLNVIEESMPPLSREMRHAHAVARQFFYVLRGSLTIEVDGVTHTVQSQHGIEVAPGSPHEVRNDSTSERADFLVVSQPPVGNDRVAVPSA